MELSWRCGRLKMVDHSRCGAKSKTEIMSVLLKVGCSQIALLLVADWIVVCPGATASERAP